MDILAALPKTPGMAPEALWAWLKRNGKIHPQELIRYKTTKLADPLTGIREKYAACNCTACGESWHTTIALPGEGGAYPYFDTEEGPRRNGETIHCPNCGTAALVAHEKRLDRWPIVKKAYPWEIRKAGGCVMFICWAAIHETGYDWENWKAKKPHEALYMSKPEYKAASKAQGRRAWDIGVQQHAVAVCLRNGAPREYADTLGGEGVAFADKYKNLWTVQRFGLVRVWNYIRKQQESARKIHSIGGTVGFCADYWKDAERAGLDLKSEVVAFPHSVTEAQARATAAIRYKEDAALRGKFEKMAKRLQALRWEYMGLIITPAESEEQLILEGKALGHCVGGYGKAHCNGESIFFIRRTESPRESYFTLQLDTATGKVLQNRGRHNCARTPEVEAFEQAWLCQVVKPWLDNKQKTVNPNHAKTAAA